MAEKPPLVLFDPALDEVLRVVATLYLDHVSGPGAIIVLGTKAVPQGRADGWRRRSRGVLE